jgi:predicted MFS family arabinose efflux permease
MMDAAVQGRRADAASREFLFLLPTMLSGQALGTMATMTLPAVAPAVAASYGVSSSVIGYQISLLAAAMLFALAFGGNLSTRWGACRVQQVALTLLVCGCAIATIPHVAFFFASAIALGLGYGLLTPSASHLLMRFTLSERRNLLFSLKQTGVPLGGVLTAVIAPVIASRFGWRWSLALVAVCMALLIVVMQSRRSRWDDDRTSSAPIAQNPLEGVATIWRDRRLRYLSIAGACLVVPQIGISTFTVVLFAEEVGYTLVAAGTVLGASQIAGIAGRVFWGWLADLVRNCYTALAILCAVMLCGALLCFFITPGWPLAAACALFFVLGSTATGWSGAFLAEVARIAPPSAISRATGGSLFFVNVGKLLGPMLMTSAYAFSGSYAATFGLLALLAAAALGCLLTGRNISAH